MFSVWNPPVATGGAAAALLPTVAGSTDRSRTPGAAMTSPAGTGNAGMAQGANANLSVTGNPRADLW